MASRCFNKKGKIISHGNTAGSFVHIPMFKENGHFCLRFFKQGALFNYHYYNFSLKRKLQKFQTFLKINLANLFELKNWW
jgi:hypothetical protein